MVLCQVNRLIHKPFLFSSLLRYSSSAPLLKTLYPLHSRKLIKLSGNEASSFLQGLITNDMRHFEDEAKSMYAMFLNNKGRVLYDTLIYKWDDKHECFMLECDTKVHMLLQKHLKLYKLKRKVSIEDVKEDFKIWALICNIDQISNSLLQETGDVRIFKDPRILNLGFRVIINANLENDKLLEKLGNNIKLEENEDGYTYLRYCLGVSEGADDLPPATSFPLEVNCDYLHGVSFHKGCYIGQELTARVHHTGVVRKRIMPLKFPDKISNIEKDSVIIDKAKPKSNLGKLKGYINNYGIGLVRIKEALEAKHLIIGTHPVEVVKPNWWPIEAPKEKLNVIKIE